MTAVLIPCKNNYWGRRAGGFYDEKKPKGASYCWGLVVNIARGSDTGGTSNQNPAGRRKTRWYQGRATAGQTLKRKVK